jgi:hypothetical protein
VYTEAISNSHTHTLSALLLDSECIASTTVQVGIAPKFLFSDLFAVLVHYTGAVFALVLTLLVLLTGHPHDIWSGGPA